MPGQRLETKRIRKSLHKNKVTRGVLRVYLENVIRDALTNAKFSERKTVTTMDLIYALKRQGGAPYSFAA